MTKLAAPPITPCPAWCPNAGVHEWERAEGVDPHRIHTLTVLDVKTADHSTATVEAEAYEREDGTLTPSVQIPYDPELYSWDQANKVIDAIRSAATTAFGPEPKTDERADMDEFDAATAELVERAGNPTDVNRLVAAAIRFRNAFLGA